MINKTYWEYLVWYSFFSFVIFASWEWIQTPFFIDITKDINTIVWFRIHCTIGDMLILFFSISGTSLVFRKINWILRPSKLHYLSVTIMGVAYTLFSEVRNVHILKSWGYSDLMPKIFGIGLIPIIQWLLLPALILYILSRFHINKN